MLCVWDEDEIEAEEIESVRHMRDGGSVSRGIHCELYATVWRRFPFVKECWVWVHIDLHWLFLLNYHLYFAYDRDIKGLVALVQEKHCPAAIVFTKVAEARGFQKPRHGGNE